MYDLGGFLPGSLGGGQGPGGWDGAERFACMTQEPKISVFTVPEAKI